MWIQKKLDIRWNHLIFSLLFPFPSFFLGRDKLLKRISSLWSAKCHSFICLSVRTGFDLLLSALNFGAGGEIIVVAINIAHMFKIIEDHKLKVVPVDVDIQTLQPDIAALKSMINRNTRAVMVTHLFGAKIDIEPVREAIKNQNILLIEDSSQYLYELNEDLRSDIKMNSFGTIKTMTALGGAILSVRDGGLFEELKKRYSDYASQSEISYKIKVLKTMLLKFISSRPVFKMLNLICTLFKIDIDKMMYQATKSFTGSDFYDKIRMRPSKQLLLMLAKRLACHSRANIDRHREECLKLNEGLSRRYLIPGIKAKHHTYWVCPVLSKKLQNKIPYFRSKNFFLSAQHGICLYGGAAAGELKNSETIINNVVYLPFYPEMPQREKKRLESLLTDDFLIKQQGAGSR